MLVVKSGPCPAKTSQAVSVRECTSVGVEKIFGSGTKLIVSSKCFQRLIFLSFVMEKLWSKCRQLFKVSGEAHSRSGLCYLLSMIITEAAGKQDKNAVYELSVLNALRSHWLGGGTEEL